MYSIWGKYIENGSIKDVCVYSDTYTTPQFKAVNPTITLTDNSAGSLEMTLTPGNDGYEKLRRMMPGIRVLKNEHEIWEGRILSEQKDFNNNRILTCEGQLAYLNDSIQPPREYSKEYFEDKENASYLDEEEKTGVTVGTFLKKVLEEHNKNVDESKQFLNNDDYVNATYIWKFDEKLPIVYTNYECTLDCVVENLLNRFGGHIVVEKNSDGKRYLRYFEKNVDESRQVIRFGDNLLDCAKNWDMSDLTTVLTPKGASLEESEISESIESFTQISDLELTDEDHRYIILKRLEEKSGSGVWYQLWVYEYQYAETHTEYDLIPTNLSVNMPSFTSTQDNPKTFKMEGRGIKLRFTENGKTVYPKPIQYDFDFDENGNEIDLPRSSTLFTADSNITGLIKEGTNDCIVLFLDESDEDRVILAREFDENGDPSGNPTVTWDGRRLNSLPAIKAYGRFEKTVDFEDEADQIELLQGAIDYLTDGQFDSMTLEVSAVDLSYKDINAEPLMLLDNLKCVSLPHGINNVSFSVTQLSIPIDTPDGAKYTLETTAKASLAGTNTLTSATNTKAEETDKKISSTLAKAKKNADLLISQATNGYITTVVEEEKRPKYSEALVISSSPDYRTSEHYWVWNINGLAHYTRTGEADEVKTKDKGLPYTVEETVSSDAKILDVAITMDGQIYANYITVGTMSADRVRTGFLVSQDNNVVWNLNSSEAEYNERIYPAGSLTIKNGSINLGNDNFAVSNDGKLTAKSGTVGGFTITEDSIGNNFIEMNSYNLTFRYTEDEDDTAIGKFAVDHYVGSGGIHHYDKRGIVMDLEPDGKYIAWGVPAKAGSVYDYEYKLFYVAPGAKIEGRKNDMLYFGCAINTNGQVIYVGDKQAYNGPIAIDAVSSVSSNGMGGVTGTKTRHTLQFNNGLFLGLSTSTSIF